MLSIAFKTATAAIAAAGLAFASADELTLGSPYDGEKLKWLDETALTDHASAVFQRADLDQSGALNADEYAALAIISAELARLNGFVVIETSAGPSTVPLRSTAPASMSGAEHARIDAVARSNFYNAAGEDGRMDEEEYLSAQRAVFDAADFNANGSLRKAELELFAERQAMTQIGA